ncbi:MAG: hypothetical protein H7X86_13750 [Gorillibacterium sp.]|nr:hypothetical protein [Gorillibacterium sp.]
MDQWSSFLSDRWYVVLIALLALFLVFKLVKTIVKWVLVLIVAAAVLYYGYHYTDSLETLTKSVTETVTETVKDQAIKLMVEEGKEASYKNNGDGSFTISSKNVRVDGKVGAKEVKVTVFKQSFQMKTEIVKSFIEQASKNK